MNIDENIENADWTKTTWDLPAGNVEELRAWLAGQQINVKHFMELPAYKLNVEKLPWLRDLRPVEVRQFFNPRHEANSGRFAPRAGGPRKPTVIGVTPNRGPKTPEQVQPYFSTTRYKGFENTAKSSAPAHNVKLLKSERATGFWEGDLEPSAQLKVSGKPSDVKGYASALGKKFNQDAVVTFTPRKNGTSRRYRFKVDDPNVGIKALKDAGIVGATVKGHTVEVLDLDGSSHGAVLGLRKTLGPGSVSHGVGRLFAKGKDYASAIMISVMTSEN